MDPRTRIPPAAQPRAAALALLVSAAALAGCTGTDPAALPQAGPAGSYRALGFDGTTWPDLHGQKVVVLSYDAFGFAFEDAKAAFEGLTNGTVELLTEEDTGKALERAVREKGDPSFDVLYGVDNVLLGKARREGVFAPYQPILGEHVRQDLRIAPDGFATPVNHGYIAVNVDPRANLTVRTLDDVKAHAASFVTEDPRTSTPGLGFLLATVATYGEADPARYDYLDYWNDLFRGGVTITSSWTQAYAERFSGGYGQFEEGARVDKPIVTSYTTSPAYEMYYGYDTLNANVLAPKATFHQVQTMGIVAGAKHRAAAEAWIEFALSDAFQELAPKAEAIYPAVASRRADAAVQAVFQGRDPAPGSFQDTGLTPEQLDAGVERWVRAWTDAYERHRAG